MTSRSFDPTRVLSALLGELEAPLMWRGVEYPSLMVLAPNMLLPIIYTRAHAKALTLFSGQAAQFITLDDDQSFLGRRAVVNRIEGYGLDVQIRLLLIADAFEETFRPLKGKPIDCEPLIETYARLFNVLPPEDFPSQVPMDVALEAPVERNGIAAEAVAPAALGAPS